MGTWGSDSFENDEALDWVGDFCDAPAKELVLNALSRVAEMDFFDCLEASVCNVGIAAAEVVAALKGAPNPNFPDEAMACLSRRTIVADSSLVHIALKAVERIKIDSELKEVWDESENPDEWYSAVGNLEVRLKESDLGAVFDLILDKMRAEEAAATESSKPISRRAEPPVESAASIEEVFMEDIGRRLWELVPEPTGTGASDGPVEFDEDLYQQLKPLFSAILADALKKR